MIRGINPSRSLAFKGNFEINAPKLDKRKNGQLSTIIAETIIDRGSRNIMGATLGITDANGISHVIYGEEGSFIQSMFEAFQKNKFEPIKLENQALRESLNHVASTALKYEVNFFG